MQNQGSCFKISVGVVLFLSLAGNVFMFGMVAGGKGVDRMARFEKIGTAIASYADLSDGSQEKVKVILKRELPEIKKEAKAMKERGEQIKALFLKPDFKRDEVEKLFAEQRSALTAIQTRGQNLGLDLADSMTPEERAKVVEALAK
ncbi:MAG: periplasmic heavy metal sensor [Alphaproteobacteria bacterium]